MDGSWGAMCSKCVKYYNTDGDWFSKREMTHMRSIGHVLLQLRDGTMSSEGETTLLARARVGGVSFKEYVDLAIKMMFGDAVVRGSLSEAFPSLGLEIWVPAS